MTPSQVIVYSCCGGRIVVALWRAYCIVRDIATLLQIRSYMHATCSRPDKLCLRHRYIGKSKSKLLLPEIRYRSISWCVKLCLICGKVIGAICRSYSTDNAKH